MTIGGSNVSFNNIQVELGRGSGTSNMSIHSAEVGSYATLKPCQAGPSIRTSPNGTDPNSVGEWFGYDHSYTPPNCYSKTLATGTSYSNACSNYSSNTNKSTYYTNCSNFGANCAIRSEQCCVNGANATYYSDGTNAFSYDGGITDSGQSCTQSTTTTAAPTTTTQSPCSCVGSTCTQDCPASNCYCNNSSDCQSGNPC